MTSPALDAERAVLGAMLLRPAVIDEVTEYLDPDDYSRGAHADIHRAIVALHHDGQAVDPITVTDRLRDQGILDAVGGIGTIETLADSVATAANAADHARIVAEDGARRRAEQAARRLLDAVTDDSRDLEAVVADGIDEIATATRRRGARGLVTPLDTLDEVREIRDTGGQQGVSTGWPDLDRLYRPARGQLTVVTGVPSHGKSTWLDALALNLMWREGWRFAMWSPERLRGKHHARLLSTLSDKPIEEHTDDEIEGGLHFLSQHLVRIDDTAEVTVPSVLATATAADRQDSLDGLIIDPWNWLEASKPDPNMPDTAWIGLALSKIMRWAQNHGVHVWVVAHPRKIQTKPESNDYEVPKPYDISDSANWYNKPDWAIAVWRPTDVDPNETTLTEIHVQKVRDDDLGRNGKAELVWLPNRRYGNLAGR